MKSSIAVLFLSVASVFGSALPSIFERNTCPVCVASPNNCDITAPCANFVNKLYCACRPGYKAAQYPDNDTAHQWRIDTLPGHEHRVWVAPGVACNDLCDNPWGTTPCYEVAVADACAPTGY